MTLLEKTRRQEERLEVAITKANKVFWDSIQESYPEVKTPGIPHMTFHWKGNLHHVVIDWLWSGGFFDKAE